MRKLINGVLVITIGLVLGYCGASVAERGNEPAIYCGSEEDDCRPDYRGNGKWVIFPNANN